jgi:hypothetical protein
MGSGDVSQGGGGTGDSFSVGPGVVGGHTFIVGRLKDGVIQIDPNFKRVNPYEAIFLTKGVALGDDRFRAEEQTTNPDSTKPRKYPDVGEDMGFNDSYLSKRGVPPSLLHGSHWHHPALDVTPSTVRKYDDAEARDAKGKWTAGGGSVGNEEIQQQAQAYVEGQGRPYVPPTTEPLDQEKAGKIAEAYDKMPPAPNDPKVKAAYSALGHETMAQYQVVKNAGITVEPAPEGKEPYPDAGDMVRDVRDNKHMYYYPTDAAFGGGDQGKLDPSQNPLLADSGEKDATGRPMLLNDVFRVVHDYFGHAAGGHNFRPQGEENAWRSHAAMYSPEALPAVTTETRGQTSWVYYGPHGEANRKAEKGGKVRFADQKTGLMPDATLKAAVVAFLAKWVRKYDDSEARDESGKWTSGGGVPRTDPDLVHDFPESDDPPEGIETFKVPLRDVSEELLMSPEGQTYSGGSHVQMARAMGENVSDIIENKGWVRGRIDGTSIGLEFNLKNQKALKNAIAVLRTHGKGVDSVFIDPPLGDKPIDEHKGGRWLDRGAIGDAIRYLEAKVKKPAVHKIVEPDRYPVSKAEAAETDGKVRLGKCYQLAAYYVAMGPVRKGASLVHGTVEILGIPIGHAWVEFRSTHGDDVVYDGTQGQFYAKSSYYRVMRAVPEQTYTATEAREKMLKHKRFGPWGETAGMLRGSPR